MHSYLISSGWLWILFSLTLGRKEDGNRTIDLADDGSCVDREGRQIAHGERFAPEEDPCKVCDCVRGIPTVCTMVQCSPPSCPKWKPVSNECCQFHCIGGNSSWSDQWHEGGSFDIRLALSATTSLLIVALLVFMLHRLRKRRLLIIMRRISEEQRCIGDESPYSADDVAAFDFLAFKEPPPPYTTPPQTLDRRYDPPSYEATAADASATALLQNREMGGAYAGAASMVPAVGVGNEMDCEWQESRPVDAFYSQV